MPNSYAGISTKRFLELINQSPEFCSYIHQSMIMVEASLEKMVPLVDGRLAATVFVPSELAHLAENPPTVDLEPEPVERSEIGV